MSNRIINREAIEELATALEELKDEMVFIGGSVIALYADDFSAEEIRQTDDIDLTIKMMSYGDWAGLEERLAELKIYPDPEGHSVCSYKYNNIAVDIMPSEDNHRGVSNSWYRLGFDSLKVVTIGKVDIQIFSTPVYLATKFEAYNNRGKGDYRTSHDFEDIIFVIDNRSNIVTEMANADEPVRDFLKKEIKKILENKYRDEILSAHLHPMGIDERLPDLLVKLGEIVEQ